MFHCMPIFTMCETKLLKGQSCFGTLDFIITVTVVNARVNAVRETTEGLVFCFVLVVCAGGVGAVGRTAGILL